MNKKHYTLWTSAIFAASLLLSGCQGLTGYQKIDEAKNAKVLTGKIRPIDGEVNIVCAGTYHCEIVQIDRTLIIAPDSHEPVDPNILAALSTYGGTNHNDAKNTTNVPINMTPLINKNAIKIVPLSASAMPGLINYYARVLPAKREVHINFYPENNRSYIERFAIIHDFAKAGNYQLHAYQTKSNATSGSLLEAASPEPLCVELLQDNKVQRRFCKTLDAGNQGEFVETEMIEPLLDGSKVKEIEA